LFHEKWFSGNHFPNFPVFVCHQKKWSMENTFQSKKNLTWFLEKCFSFILGGKHFPEVVKNLEMSCYLLIILNLVLKLLIDIYLVLNLFFLISSLIILFNFIFISILILIFIIVICFSLIIFLIEIFYLSDLISFF